MFGSHLGNFLFKALGIDTSDSRWHLQKEHVPQPMMQSSESSPGPDGIPYRALKHTLELSAEVLFEASLPLPVLGGFNSPALTRPLSVVNTNNRIFANAVRMVLEPLSSLLVSSVQQGFLRGRSMLQNIIDIKLESMVASLHDDRPALMFLTSKRLSQEFPMSI